MVPKIVLKIHNFYIKIGSTFPGSVFGHPVKLKKNSSLADRAEFLAESLIVNGEAHATRTTEALLDPQIARFVVAADQCKDNDRVLTSKLKGTDFMVSYCKKSRRADLKASLSCFSEYCC